MFLSDHLDRDYPCPYHKLTLSSLFLHPLASILSLLQVPQFVLEDYIEKGRGGECNIVCTQPRRLSAISVAERVAVERGESVGLTAGYAVRLDAKKSAETRLLFCTTGLLLRRVCCARLWRVLSACMLQ